MIVRQPTVIGVGEAGDERVTITPLSGGGGASGGLHIGTINLPQVRNARQFLEELRQLYADEAQRGWAPQSNWMGSHTK